MSFIHGTGPLEYPMTRIGIDVAFSNVSGATWSPNDWGGNLRTTLKPGHKKRPAVEKWHVS